MAGQRFSETFVNKKLCQVVKFKYLLSPNVDAFGPVKIKKIKFLKISKVQFWHLNISWFYSTFLHAENKVVLTVVYARM